MENYTQLMLVMFSSSLLFIITIGISFLILYKARKLKKRENNLDEINDLLVNAKWAIDGLLNQYCECEDGKLSQEEVKYYDGLIKMIEDKIE